MGKPLRKLHEEAMDLLGAMRRLEDSLNEPAILSEVREWFWQHPKVSEALEELRDKIRQHDRSFMPIDYDFGEPR